MSLVPVSRPSVSVSASLTNLAELRSSYGTLRTFWDAEHRHAFLEWKGQWFQTEDSNIVDTVHKVMEYDLTFPLRQGQLAISGLRVYEGLQNITSWTNGYSADSKLETDLAGCDWSDYANDYMAFQGSFEIANRT